MASASVGVGPVKLSFAKVAAMKAPAPPIVAAESNTDIEKREITNKGSSARRTTVVRSLPSLNHPSEPVVIADPAADSNHRAVASNGVIDGIEELSLESRKAEAEVNGHTGDGSADSTEETRSNLSNSSTKQHSLDNKSVASATTFAMDEKESIRPDDSASVRAVDDEDANSVVGRPTTFSQEPDVILPPLRTIIPRPGMAPVTIGSRRFQTLINPPRFGDLEMETPEAINVTSAPVQTPQPVSQEDAIRSAAVPIPPDEKLLDALASPKERLPILQLEERLLALLKQTEMQFIDLPPQNSYARLLAHKLADYYGLHHHITEDGMSVRIFRSLEPEMPVTLATLAQSIPIGPPPPPGPTAVKIMRRAGLADSTAPSSSASKATSEAGHSEEGLASPTDSTPNRDKSKMTREEREAQYKAVRERIFGDFQELSVSESNSTGENSASMSRSSSSSGKKKSRRQKAPKDDSFEARSAFVASYPHAHGAVSQQPYQQAQYIDPNFHDPYNSQASLYPAQMNYGTTPTQSQPGFDQMPNFGMMDTRQQYGAADPWATPQPGSYYGYQPAQAPGMYPVHQTVSANAHTNPQFGSGFQNMHQQGAWTPNQFGNPHSQSQPTSPGPGAPWGGASGFNYGQQNLSQNYGIPTPITSPVGNNSANRSLFNPQTRSFVPSNASSRAGSRNAQRKKPSSSNGTSQPHVRNSLPARQSSGGQMSSLPFPTRSNFMAQGSGLEVAEETLKKKYGTPANLPKKPPPSQVHQHFDHGGLGVRNPSAPIPPVDLTGGVLEGQPNPQA